MGLQYQVEGAVNAETLRRRIALLDLQIPRAWSGEAARHFLTLYLVYLLADKERREHG